MHAGSGKSTLKITYLHAGGGIISATLIRALGSAKSCKAYNEGGSLLVDFDSTVKGLTDLMAFAAMVEALDKRQSPQSHDDLGSFSFCIPRFFLHGLFQRSFFS
jgi:hypothetical protein